MWKNTHDIIFGAVFIACGILLPMVCHFSGISGSVFLPMHIPVLVGGLILGRRVGFLIGLLTPLLSSLTTGMPPIFPVMPMMIVELGLYGFVSGYMYHDQLWPLLPSLLVAMIAGRLGIAALVALFAEALNIHIPPLAYVTASVGQGMVGIVVQLFFIPILIKRLQQITRYKRGV